MKVQKTEADLKQIVRDKYAAIAVSQGQSSCCGPSGCGTDYSFIGDEYTTVEGYVPEADLGLGCGLPTEFAKIKEGDTVVDLGSGAGNDCFVARAETGPSGKVIGVDFTLEMVEKARANAQKLGYDNVQFQLGEIDHNPLPDNIADVVVSNCVFNLVPNRRRAFEETFRITKPGGHFSISDVVVTGQVPTALRDEAELYAGCVSGAMDKKAYLQVIQDAGFTNVTLQKERVIELPEELLDRFLDSEKKQLWKSSQVGIFSITVYGEKPKDEEACCGPTCC